MLGQCSELRLVLPPLSVFHRTVNGSSSHHVSVFNENKGHERHGDDHHLLEEDYIHSYFPWGFFGFFAYLFVVFFVQRMNSNTWSSCKC